ncbi:MAG: D-glycero-beta-D-manno-heptose-7-phosphate kinase [Bacteroidetes bacterium]|nr:D-glycero-beta-D-manno-heptose-7-phosphate kinase [Bacteroidota bacterium]
MLSNHTISGLFNAFNDLKVLIVGDVMIDANLFGKVERISPEAPVPIVLIENRKSLLGGAANVALNIKSMGAIPIMCSIIGTDTRGDEFLQLMEDQNMRNDGIIRSSFRPTTTKYRVIGNKMQMLRVDEEIDTDLTEEESNQFLKRIEEIIEAEKVDVIIFEDYNKGVLTAKVIEKVIALANKLGIPTTVDPKKKNFDQYNQVTLFKPNLKELREGLKIDVNPEDPASLTNALNLLQEKQQIKIAMTTLSEYGVFIRGLDSDKNESYFQIPAHRRAITDVSGAGDTVISVASLCLALNQHIALIAALSNLAGGLVCEHIGVVPVNRERLMKETTLLLQDYFSL